MTVLRPDDKEAEAAWNRHQRFPVPPGRKPDWVYRLGIRTENTFRLRVRHEPPKKAQYKQ